MRVVSFSVRLVRSSSEIAYEGSLLRKRLLSRVSYRFAKESPL